VCPNQGTHCHPGTLCFAELGGSSDQPPDIDGIRRKYLAKVLRVHEAPRDLVRLEVHSAGPIDCRNRVDHRRGRSRVHVGDPRTRRRCARSHNTQSRWFHPMQPSHLADTSARNSKDIRTIVPHLALSAASMLACVSNRLIMAKHSFLGPHRPAVSDRHPYRIEMGRGPEHRQANSSSPRSNARILRIWPFGAPILPQYGPDLLGTMPQLFARRRSNRFRVARALICFLRRNPSEERLGAMVRKMVAKHENHFKSHARTSTGMNFARNQ